MFKFLHAADIHLDSPLRGLERYPGVPVDSIRGTTRQAFNNLINLAIEEEVAFVLLAGDIYDGDWKDYNTGLFFAKGMAQLREANIRVFMIAGNHDASSQITRVLRLPENVTFFPHREAHTAIVDEFGVAIHGQSFASRAVTEDLTAGYPQGDPQLFNIGLLHTCLNGKPGHEPYAPCTIDGLRTKGYQYWALGHVHNREEVFRDPWIVFPGNIQGRHIREIGPKGCTLVTVEAGEISTVQHCKLDVLRWSICQADVSGTTTTDEVYERVRAVLKGVLEMSEGRLVAVRLILEGAFQAHARLHANSEHWVQEFRALATDLSGDGLLLEKLILNTRRTITMDTAMQRSDALGGLLRAIRDLELDSNAPAQLAAEFSDLRQKLPSELLSGEGAYDPTAPANLREALEEMKELLIAKLLSMDSGE